MFCTNCGNKMNENSKFCTNCGMQVGNNIVTQKSNSKKISITSCIVIPLVLAIILFILPWFINVGFILFNMEPPFENSAIMLLVQIVLPIITILFGPFIIYGIKVLKSK